MRALPTIAALLLGGCLDTLLPAPTDVPMASDAGSAWCFVLPEVIDFGEVEVDGAGLRHFSATNASSARQRLTLGALDFPFTGAITRETVSPGGDADLLFTFTASDGLAHVARTTFVGGNDCPEQRLEFRALGGGSLTAPAELAFGPLELNVPSTRALRLFNTRRFPVEVDLVDSDRNPIFTISTAHVTVPATGSIDVALGFTALLPGPAETRVLIDSSAGDRLSVVVSAMGGLPVASVSPTTIDIARLPISESVFRVFNVFNSGIGDLEVSQLRVVQSDGGATSEAMAIAFTTFVSPDASVPLSIQFAPRSAGPRDWVAQFTTSDRDRPVLSVQIHAMAEDIAECPMALMVPQMMVVTAPSTFEIGFDNSLGTVDCLIDDPRVQSANVPGLPVLLEPEPQFVVPAGRRVVRTLRVSQPGVSTFLYHPIGRGTLATFVEAL